MSDGDKSDERSVGAPLCDGEGMAAILMVMDSVKLGPGTYGPGDEWRFPTGSLDEAENVDEAVAEPVVAGRSVGLLRRWTRRR